MTQKDNDKKYTITDILGFGKLFGSDNLFWAMLFSVIVIGMFLDKC